VAQAMARAQTMVREGFMDPRILQRGGVGGGPPPSFA
jgi:hypothetical protein